MGIVHAYTNSVADVSTAGIVHPADWLADHVIAAGTALNGLAPVGCVLPFGGLIEDIPAGWLLCDGISLDRVGTYAGLYGAIGTVWGSADGDHYNLPNLVDHFIAGAKQDSGGKPMASITGGLTQSFVAASAALTHSLTIVNHTIAAHSGLAVGDHTFSHVNAAVAAHPELSLTGTVGAHPTVAMATNTKSASRTTAVTGGGHTVNWPTRAALTHTLTQVAGHTVTHDVTQPTSHAGDLTHSFTPPANHSLAAAVPAFLALAYIIRAL